MHLGACEHSMRTVREQRLFFISDFFCFIETKHHSVSPGWPQTHFVAQAEFQFITIFLPQFPDYWDYRVESPCLAESKLFEKKKKDIIGCRK